MCDLCELYCARPRLPYRMLRHVCICGCTRTCIYDYTFGSLCEYNPSFTKRTHSHALYSLLLSSKRFNCFCVHKLVVEYLDPRSSEMVQNVRVDLIYMDPAKRYGGLQHFTASCDNVSSAFSMTFSGSQSQGNSTLSGLFPPRTPPGGKESKV